MMDELLRTLAFYGDDISYVPTQQREPRTAVHGDAGRRAREMGQKLLSPSQADPVLAMAKAINGPYKQPHPESQFTLEQLRDIRWENLRDHERAVLIQQARSALAEFMPTSMITTAFSFAAKIKNDRDLRSVHNHMLREVKELDEEIAQVMKGEDEGEDGVVGEAIDVMLCALDLIYQHQPHISEAEINRIARKKCEKWQSKERQKQSA